MSKTVKSEMRGLGDYINPDVYKPKYRKPREFPGEVLMLDSFSFERKGYGEYAVMHIRRYETGEEFVVTSGASAILSVLYELASRNDVQYPLLFKFAQQGRADYMTSAE